MYQGILLRRGLKQGLRDYPVYEDAFPQEFLHFPNFNAKFGQK